MTGETGLAAIFRVPRREQAKTGEGNRWECVLADGGARYAGADRRVGSSSAIGETKNSAGGPVFRLTDPLRRLACLSIRRDLIPVNSFKNDPALALVSRFSRLLTHVETATAIGLSSATSESNFEPRGRGKEEALRAPLVISREFLNVRSYVSFRALAALRIIIIIITIKIIITTMTIIIIIAAW